jgi:hypothetical protein
MKIDLRFTLDSINESHRKAIHVYDSLRRKYRVDFFVELTKSFWDKDLVEYPNINIDVKTEKNPSSSHSKTVLSDTSALKFDHETQDLSDDRTFYEKPKKRNLLLG